MVIVYYDKKIETILCRQYEWSMFAKLQISVTFLNKKLTFV